MYQSKDFPGATKKQNHIMDSFPGQPGTRKVKPIWILMQQDVIGWQWYQLDHMQIICTLLQIDNHASTSILNFLQVACSS